jgi:hypothetical protein
MLEREEALAVLRALDDAGFPCTLTVSVDRGGGRRYEVSTHLRGLSGPELRDAQDAIAKAVVDEPQMVVDEYGTLIVQDVCRD